jgi:hypothetical protein
MVDENGLDLVVQEKANYITSIVTQEIQDIDISDAFLELFHKDLLVSDREKLHVSQPEPRKNKGHSDQNGPRSQLSDKYVAGKRNSARNGNKNQSKNIKKSNKEPKTRV